MFRSSLLFFFLEWKHHQLTMTCGLTQKVFAVDVDRLTVERVLCLDGRNFEALVSF